MYQFLFVFFIYAFLGWCMEVCFAALDTGRFVNRGFLNGPVCPIYGFGVLLVVYLLQPLRVNLLLLFLGSMLVTTVLEFLVGFLLEKLFSQRWWDYSNEKFNLSGYVCLRFSIMWGIACVLVVELIHPTVLWLIDLVPELVGMVALALFSVMMLADMTATVRSILKINKQLGQIDEVAQNIRKLSNDLGENLADTMFLAAEKRAGIQENLSELKEELSGRKDALTENFSDFVDEMKTDMEERREAWQQKQVAQQQAQQQKVEELKQRLEQLLRPGDRVQNRILDAYPKLRSLRHTSALEQLRIWRKNRQKDTHKATDDAPDKGLK